MGNKSGGGENRVLIAIFGRSRIKREITPGRGRPLSISTE